uniref:Sodium-coupled monocarboxylate transporter 1-like n=2 Tax=Hirondellea gigas TaxID=1518452 RepID=A0A6A7G1E6_9CRUS
MGGAATFEVVDYCMLVLTVVVSLAIGVYHAFRGNKTSEDYAMGSRNMKAFPVSLSLLATFLSANSILGYSGEVYGNGLGITWTIVGTTLAIFLALGFIMPVMYPLKLVTPNQYLELRFKSPWLRRLSMGMSFLSIVVFMGLALYAPTLALSAVTPISFSNYIWIMGIVVTIYASIGGLKAVVWADVFQMVLMVGGVLLITVMACIEVGGLGRAWAIASEGGRTNGLVDISTDLYTRHTVWNIILMTMTNWGSHYSVSQATYQRISSVPTIQQARRVLFYNIIGMTGFLLMVFVMGLCIYSVYAGCDPYARGHIFSKDQIAVYFVKDKLSHLPGVPGIFVATLLSAALSSLSSGLNTLATLLWADIFSPMPCFKGASEFVATTTSKILTVCLGALCVGMAFLASKLGGLVQAGYTVVGVMAGPVLGVYLLGMAVPFCNKKGAFSGLLSGWGFCVWIAIGGYLYKPAAELLPFSADDCPLQSNISILATTIRTTTIADTTTALINTLVACDPSIDASCVTDASRGGLMSLYTISYTHLSFIGLVTCLTVGILISLVSGYQSPSDVPGELVLVCLRRFTAPATDVEKPTDRKAKLTNSGTVETLVLDSVSLSTDPSKDERLRY